MATYFVYKPEGREDNPYKWEFDPSRLMSPEAEAIERHTGLEFGEWQTALGKGSVRAIHGLLYVLLKREVPSIKYDDVQFNLSEVDVEQDEDPDPKA